MLPRSCLFYSLPWYPSSVTISSQSQCQVSFLRLILRMAPEVWSSGWNSNWWWTCDWCDGLTVISSTQASWGTNVFAYAPAVSVTRVECSLQAGFSHPGLHSLWTLCLDGLSVLVGIVSTCFIPSSKQANITVSVLSMAWLYQVRTWEPKSPRLSIVSQWSRTSPMSGGVSGILWYLPACSRHEVGPPATRNSGWAQAS